MRLIPGQFVKPYRKSNKNDYLDAEAIAEAVTRHNMRFVPIKTEDQLDLQALHRVRERLVHNRTEVINQIRGFLLERGITFNRGPASLRKEMPSLLEDAEQNLTPSLRTLLDHLWHEWQYLDSQVDQMSVAIEEVADRDAACRRLRKIPGVGPLVATATVAAVGNGAAFKRGREFAAWLGLVPKQHSTGGKAKLLGITKRGNPYCASCSCMERGRCCCASSTTPEASASGYTGWQPEHRATRSSWPLPTNWPGSPGSCCPAATSISTRR